MIPLWAAALEGTETNNIGDLLSGSNGEDKENQSFWLVQAIYALKKKIFICKNYLSNC